MSGKQKSVEIDVEALLSFLKREDISVKRLGEWVQNGSAIQNAVSTGRMNVSCWVLCQLIMEVPAIRKELDRRNPQLIFRKRVVTPAGVKYIKRGKNERAPFDPEEAVRLYESGKSITSLSRIYGQTMHTMKRILISSGVTEFRNINKSPYESLRPQIKKMHDEGFNLSEIKKMYPLVSRMTLYRIVSGFYDKGHRPVDVPSTGETQDVYSEGTDESIPEGEGTLLPLYPEDTGPSGREVGGGARSQDRERRFEYFVKSKGGTRQVSQDEIEDRKNGIRQGAPHPGQIHRRG